MGRRALAVTENISLGRAGGLRRLRLLEARPFASGVVLLRYGTG
jgi:hypothetical protein